MASPSNILVKHSSIYFLGTIIRNASSFIMLPIYTRFLTPEDYGVIELLSMIIDFVSIILGLRLGEAIFRYYRSYDNEGERHSLISTSFYLVVGINILGVLLIMMLAPNISIAVYGESGYEQYITLFSLSLLFASSQEIGFIYVRANLQPWLFVSFSIFRLFLQVGLNIYFVVVSEMHVLGVIYSALISGLIISILVSGYMFSRVGFGFSRLQAKSLVIFSWPLMLAAVGNFYLTFGDRYFLRLYSDLSAVGIYSLGYKLGFILLVFVWTPFSNIWDTQRYDIQKQENANQEYGKVFLFISYLLILSALAIALFSKDLFYVMSSEEFWPAYKIVPIILTAYIFQCWTAYANLGLLLKNKTIHITYSIIVTIIVITGLYLVLIPKYGAQGAAWATLAAFFVRLLWIHHAAKRLYDMQLPFKNVTAIGLLAILVYVTSELFSSVNIYYSIVVHAIAFLIFFVTTLTLPIIDSDMQNKIISIIKNPMVIKNEFT